MKNRQLLTFLVLVLFCIPKSQAQPSNEIACFDNFQYNNSGNSKMNAYLLAMVSYNMYPRNLLNVESGDSEANSLLRTPDLFETEFKNRLGHWFRTNKKSPIVAPTGKPGATIRLGNTSGISKPRSQALQGAVANQLPIFDFITANNETGYDPEAMIISTKEYIILAWRGTDRVANNNSTLAGGAIFEFGEWFSTNFNYQLRNAPNGIQGQVHRGFSESILEDNMIARVARRLKQLGVKNKKLWITGHSLGGAHAQIAALYLQKMHQIRPFAVYTYASPGVGNREFNREIDRVVPRPRLQRFVFMNDPIPAVPSGLTALTSDYGTTRAGQLNYYSEEAGNGNYHYNKPYQATPPISTALCMHNPHWYARAAYFELLDRDPSLSNKLPNAPSKPTEKCQAWDYMAAEGNGNVVQNILGINEDLEPGRYFIMNARTKRFLNLKASDIGKDRKPIRASVRQNTSRFKWRIKYARDDSGTWLGGYTIGISSKIIDAERWGVGQQNSEVFTYKREGFVAAIDRRNQEWEMERNDDGSFYIKNLKNTRFSLKSTNTHRIVLDDGTNDYSKWFLVKAN